MSVTGFNRRRRSIKSSLLALDIKELKQKAKEKQIKGYQQMSKAELLKALGV